MLLLQKFDFKFKDRKYCENQVADHLSTLENGGIQKESWRLMIHPRMNKSLLLSLTLFLGFANYANYLMSDIILEYLSFQQQKKFLHDVNKYFWDTSYFFHLYTDNIVRRYVP